MTPIERAARAMYDNIRPGWDWDDPDTEPMRQMYRENARVAIAAIRESDAATMKPDSLLSQFYHAAGGDEGKAYFEPEKAKRYWHAMIDAILGD